MNISACRTENTEISVNLALTNKNIFRTGRIQTLKPLKNHIAHAFYMGGSDLILLIYLAV